MLPQVNPGLYNGGEGPGWDWAGACPPPAHTWAWRGPWELGTCPAVSAHRAQHPARVGLEAWCLLLQVGAMTSFAEFRRELQVLSGRDAGSSLQGTFEAVSRIACGHPEGGDLKIPSLNWYEDNDIKAFLNRNSSEQGAVPLDNATSE